MKRTKIKRKSKTPLEKAKGKLWELCKQLVRKRDGHSCVSCGKTGLVGSSNIKTPSGVFLCIMYV